MKYLTPELLGRYRSPDDAVADAAALEWENALAAYRARRKEVRRAMPFSARRALRYMATHFTLHDARIVGLLQRDKAPVLTVLARLQTPSADGADSVSFNYLLASGRPGETMTAVLPEIGGQGRRVHILYDEFDTGPEDGHFTHSLLMSTGRVITFGFRDLSISGVKSVTGPMAADPAASEPFAFARTA